MAISFIITTFNIRSYIGRCLESVAAVARPGDQVILIDDGSDDGTLETVQAFAAEDHFAQDVELLPVYLGTNTMGGVGIGANIGLCAATRDTVFFVDGDDWIDHAGFTRARAYLAMHPTDILVANYLEYDESADRSKHPADASRWAKLDNGLPLETLRDHAIGLIAVPWRKFYRREFLEKNKLRFPEGDFFFEDNPFHWAVCLRADSIGFVNSTVCHHRINRPGQTMASTGKELAAFFTHFQTIIAGFPRSNRSDMLGACLWLLNNMTWHMGRLSSSARPHYATAAHDALKNIPEDIWLILQDSESDRAIWPVARRLRKGDVDGQIHQWQNMALERDLAQLKERISSLESTAKDVSLAIRGQSAAAMFESIHASYGVIDR